MLVGQQRVLAPARFVERAIDDAFGRLGHLVLRNVEVFHGRLPDAATLRLYRPAQLLTSTAKAGPPIDRRTARNRCKER